MLRLDVDRLLNLSNIYRDELLYGVSSRVLGVVQAINENFDTQISNKTINKINKLYGYSFKEALKPDQFINCLLMFDLKGLDVRLLQKKLDKRDILSAYRRFNQLKDKGIIKTSENIVLFSGGRFTTAEFAKFISRFSKTVDLNIESDISILTKLYKSLPSPLTMGYDKRANDICPFISCLDDDWFKYRSKGILLPNRYLISLLDYACDLSAVDISSKNKIVKKINDRLNYVCDFFRFSVKYSDTFRIKEFTSAFKQNGFPSANKFLAKYLEFLSDTSKSGLVNINAYLPRSREFSSFLNEYVGNLYSTGENIINHLRNYLLFITKPKDKIALYVIRRPSKKVQNAIPSDLFTKIAGGTRKLILVNSIHSRVLLEDGCAVIVD